MMNKSACIILNYNNYTDTIKCVKNVFAIGALVDVVVVDNASPNNSFEVISNCFAGLSNFFLIKAEKNLGYAAGNNVGIRYIEKNLPNVEFIFIMNPDTLFDDPKVITQTEQTFNENNLYAVVAPVMKERGIPQLEKTAWKIPSGFRLVLLQLMFFNKKKNYCNAAENMGTIEVDAVSGSFFAIRLDALKKIGYLDENTFLYCEETLLGIKLKKLGLKEVVMVDTYFHHNHPPLSKSRNVTLASRIRREMACDMKSRIYICRNFYPRVYLPFLYVTSVMNLLYVCLIHLGFLTKKLLMK